MKCLPRSMDIVEILINDHDAANPQDDGSKSNFFYFFFHFCFVFTKRRALSFVNLDLYYSVFIANIFIQVVAESACLIVSTINVST